MRAGNGRQHEAVQVVQDGPGDQLAERTGIAGIGAAERS